MKHRLHRMAYVVAFCVAMLFSFHASAESPEYKLKAAFIYNFLPFIEWPSENFPDKDSPLIIGVLGTDPFGRDLDEVFRDKRINQRPVVIHKFRSLDKVQFSHVLFISRSEQEHLPEVFSYLRGKSIFSISDIENFANQGGTLDFFIESNKLRFDINPEAARQSRLQISSKFLRLAKIVGKTN